jgi:hypothetical protein
MVDRLHWCNPDVASVPHAWLTLLFNMIMSDRHFKSPLASGYRKRFQLVKNDDR